MPEDQGSHGEPNDSWLQAPIETRLGTGALSIIQSQTPRQMCLGDTELAQMEAGVAQCSISFHEQSRVTRLLGQVQEPFAQRPCGGKLAPRMMKQPQSKEDGK